MLSTDFVEQSQCGRAMAQRNHGLMPVKLGTYRHLGIASSAYLVIAGSAYLAIVGLEYLAIAGLAYC